MSRARAELRYPPGVARAGVILIMSLRNPASIQGSQPSNRLHGISLKGAAGRRATSNLRPRDRESPRIEKSRHLA
jgi:hypothetical protein